VDPLLAEILNEILDLVGQDQVYAECGSDFPCGSTKSDCRHYPDCKRQQKKVEQTRRIRALIEEVH